VVFVDQKQLNSNNCTIQTSLSFTWSLNVID